jgi:hypothetical protein
MTARRRLTRSMRIRFAVVVAVGVAAGWVLAGTAAALGPGVFVDPGSPAGKEYGVPLSDLRGAASGHVPVGNETPPLFGIGISPASGAAGPTPGAQNGLRRSQPTRAGTRGRTGAATPSAGGAAAGLGPTGSSPVDGAVLVGLTRHGSPVPAMSLVAGLIVLGGLAVGAGLVATRRRLG